MASASSSRPRIDYTAALSSDTKETNPAGSGAAGGEDGRTLPAGREQTELGYPGRLAVLENIVNLSNDFITLIDRGYRYCFANDAYCRELERSRKQIIGRTVAQVWGEDRFLAPIKGFIDRCFAGEQVNNIDNFKFGPFVKYMHVTYSPFRDAERENAPIMHALVFSHDITRIGEIESKLTNYDYRDPITGLFNRRSLGVILEKEIEKAKLSRDKETRAVVMMSLRDMDQRGNALAGAESEGMRSPGSSHSPFDRKAGRERVFVKKRTVTRKRKCRTCFAVAVEGGGVEPVDRQFIITP